MVKGSSKLNENIDSKQQIDECVHDQEVGATHLLGIEGQLKWDAEGIVQSKNNNEQLPPRLIRVILLYHKNVILVSNHAPKLLQELHDNGQLLLEPTLLQLKLQGLYRHPPLPRPAIVYLCLVDLPVEILEGLTIHVDLIPAPVVVLRKWLHLRRKGQNIGDPVRLVHEFALLLNPPSLDRFPVNFVHVLRDFYFFKLLSLNLIPQCLLLVVLFTGKGLRVLS